MIKNFEANIIEWSFKYSDNNLKLILKGSVRKDGGYRMKNEKSIKKENIFPGKSVEENRKKFHIVFACFCWSFILIFIAVYLSLAKEFKIGDLIRFLMIPFFAGLFSLTIFNVNTAQSVLMLLKFVDFVIKILK